MRNITQKFTKPTTANSFKKSDRIYPDSKPMQSKSFGSKKNQMMQ